MVTTGKASLPAPCIVCHGRRFRLYRSIRSHLEVIPAGLDRGADVDVTIARCEDCGLLRLEDRDVARLGRLYTHDSICYEASISKVREPGDASVYSRDEFDFITVPRGRLLDVGCSTGYFLRRARSRGWDVHGIDPDARAVAYARGELGLSVQCGTLNDVDYRPGTFDVVTLWGVLEHAPEPRAELGRVHRLMRRGGQVVIAVPHVKSLSRAVARISRHDWDMFCEPGHLYHFTRPTLTRLVRQIDFHAAEWGTATCAIRGKLPFWPWREPSWERQVLTLCRRNAAFRAAYRGFLRGLDRLRLGDVLVATFVKV